MFQAVEGKYLIEKPLSILTIQVDLTGCFLAGISDLFTGKGLISPYKIQRLNTYIKPGCYVKKLFMDFVPI